MSVLHSPDTRTPERSTAEAYPYETARFHQCWWEHLAPRFDIAARGQQLLVHRKPVCKGLFQLKELRVAGWNCAWSQDLTPQRAEELETLRHSAGWDVFKMTWTSARQDRQAFEQLHAKGYPMLHAPVQPEYIADLFHGFEAYLQSLSHNGRTNLRKKVRRAQKLNPQLVMVEDEREIEPFFEEFFRHHIAYWDEKIGRSYLHDPHERAFILNWAKALHQSGNLALHRTLLDGQCVNLGMGMVFEQTYYWLLAINTGLYTEYIPGVIALYLRIQHAAEVLGVTRFNMGQGEYFYKIQSASWPEPCQELIVCNPDSLKGRAYLAWRKRQLLAANA